MKIASLRREEVQNAYRIPIKVKITLILAPVIVFVISFCFGRYGVSPYTVVEILWSKASGAAGSYSAIDASVVMVLRYPRILMCLLVGAGLSVSGVALQGMFGNPLVSPQILGVSAGAGFGAALAILMSSSVFVIQGMAILFGICAVALTYALSHTRGGNSSIYMLVLAGVITSAFFEALVSIIKFVADPFSKLPTITYWLMGSMASVTWRDLFMVAPIIIVGIAGLFVMRWRLNILSLDDDEARSMGINIQASRVMVIVLCTIITAASVSVCGIVGWVGLVIPHVGRMVVGPNHKNLIPTCLSIGGVYLLLIDNMARSLVSTEIPLSILTAMVGAPFFAYLLKRSGGQWS